MSRRLQAYGDLIWKLIAKGSILQHARFQFYHRINFIRRLFRKAGDDDAQFGLLPRDPVRAHRVAVVALDPAGFHPIQPRFVPAFEALLTAIIDHRRVPASNITLPRILRDGQGVA